MENTDAENNSQSHNVAATIPKTKLQRIGILAITGALQTTPTDLLDPHTGVLPTDLMLKKTCHRAMVCLSLLPKENPVVGLLSKYHTKKARSHAMSLQMLLQIFKSNPTTTKCIQPRQNHPNKQPDYMTHIADSQNDTIAYKKEDKAKIRIYTDRSSTNGMAGTSAVMYYAGHDKPAQTLQYRLGTETEYSTNDTEIVGATLGCWMLRNSSRLGPLSSSIYTDSKNTIRATKAKTPKSGMYLVEELNAIVAGLMGHKQIQYHGEIFTLRWIPAHKNVTGNKTADNEAKEQQQANS